MSDERKAALLIEYKDDSVYDIKRDFKKGRITKEECDFIIREMQVVEFGGEIEHNGYLSANKAIFKCVEDEMFSGRDDKKIPLLVAPTGSGKTRLIAKIMSRNLEKQIIFCLPNIATAGELSKSIGKSFPELRCAFCYGDNNITNELKGFNHIIFCTLDQLRTVRSLDPDALKGFTLIVDEAHTLVTNADYKQLTVESTEIVLENGMFDKTMFITATPNPLILRQPEDAKFKFKTLKVRQTEHRTHYTCKINYLDTTSKSKTDDIYNKISSIVRKAKGTTVVYFNESKMTQEVFNDREGWDYINADLKKSEIYTSISEDGIIPEDVKVLTTTDIITAGNNISNDDVTNVVLVGVYWPEVAKQFPARFRNVKNLMVDAIINQSEMDLYSKESKEKIGKEIKNKGNMLFGAEKEMLKELTERAEKMKGVEIDQLSTHFDGFLHGALTTGLDGTDIRVSQFAFSKMFFEIYNRNNPGFVFNYYDKENTTFLPDEIVEVTGTKLISEGKNELLEEKMLEEEERRPAIIKIVKDVHMDYIGGNKDVDFGKLKEFDIKLAKKIMGILKHRYFDIEDVDFVYKMCEDKTFKKEIKYKIMRSLVKDPGTAIDEYLVKTRMLKTGYKYSAEKLGYDERKFRAFCNVAKHVKETTVKKGELYVIANKPSIKKEFGDSIEKKCKIYFSNAIKKSKTFAKELETELLDDIIGRIND